MQKDSIFAQRRELKKRGLAVLRRHYLILAFLMLVMSLFGTEYTLPTMSWGNLSLSSPVSENPDPGNALAEADVLTSKDVLALINKGELTESKLLSEKILKKIQKAGSTSKALGRTRGVLADLVNAISSGGIFVRLAMSIKTITQSDRLSAVLFVLGSFLWYLFLFTFFRSVYSAAARRLFLEARIYEKVYFLDVVHFAAIRKWARASWIMLVRHVFLALWNLTVVGGIIKRFSYFAVPYIVAENPDLSAKDAITLSRKMMDGHKMELFKYQLTFLGWILLGAVTFGISDLVFGAAYRMTCYAEFYTKIREDAIAEKVPGTEHLNDPYLFEGADRILLYETYFEVVDEITILHEREIRLTGWRKVIADWFGIWIGSLAAKRAYDAQEGRAFALQHCRLSMEGKAYPLWLNPLWRHRKIEKPGYFFYLRHYTVWTLFLLFIAFSFAGWSWEVALHFMQTGMFANRGTLHGPWLPIYGSGGLIVLILCSRFRKNPVAEFFTAIVLCGVLEYCSAWYLETMYHQRWWSYDGYFLNLQGRICAEGLLVFGVGCCLVVYLIAPFFDYLLSKVKQQVLIGICLVLAVIYGIDYFYSMKHPNMAEGAIEEETAQTETEL